MHHSMGLLHTAPGRIRCARGCRCACCREQRDECRSCPSSSNAGRDQRGRQHFVPDPDQHALCSTVQLIWQPVNIVPNPDEHHLRCPLRLILVRSHVERIASAGRRVWQSRDRYCHCRASLCRIYLIRSRSWRRRWHRRWRSGQRGHVYHPDGSRSRVYFNKQRQGRRGHDFCRRRSACWSCGRDEDGYGILLGGCDADETCGGHVGHGGCCCCCGRFLSRQYELVWLELEGDSDDTMYYVSCTLHVFSVLFIFSYAYLSLWMVFS
jgi:hypothetical protein